MLPGSEVNRHDVRACELCGGQEFQLIPNNDPRYHPPETGICQHCGLISHMKIPTEQELDDFYTRNYRKDYYGEITPSTQRIYRAWRNGERIYGQVAPFLHTGGQLLEIGAGIGCTVKVFERQGWDASGIEPSDGFQQYSHQKLHARVSAGSLYDLPPAPAYDVALLIHVIEHFCSPRRALEHIHRVLRPGGQLYIECPNIGSPWRWPLDRIFHYAHIYNFTPMTLEGLARRCGFRLVKRFGDDEDADLQMLFEQCEPQPVDMTDHAGYQQTMHGLTRHTAVSFHLQPRYLRRRLSTLYGYLIEGLTAKKVVAEVERESGEAAVTSPSAK